MADVKLAQSFTTITIGQLKLQVQLRHVLQYFALGKSIGELTIIGYTALNIPNMTIACGFLGRSQIRTGTSDADG